MIAGTAIKAILSRIPLAGWTAAGAALVVAIPLGIQTVRLGEATDRYEYAEGRVETLASNLATSRASVAELEAAVRDYNAYVLAWEADAVARIQAAQDATAEARRNAAEAQVRADRFLARPIQGETLAARVLDVDAAVLADLGGQER